jgi:heme/copper-type cytochrome/quinol oxidase subunit 4
MNRQDDEDEQSEGSSRAKIIGVVFMILLLAVAFVITQKLRSMSAIQDCVMSGRTNCAPIIPK